MATNLLDTLKGYLTPDLISKASNLTGEPEANTQKALQGILPAILGGVIQKTASGGSEAGNLFNMLGSGDPGGILTNPGKLFDSQGGSAGSGLLNSIFGDKLGAVTGAISSYANIRNSSASTLLNSGSGLVTGVLSKLKGEQGLSLSGFTGMLANEKANILSALPAGLVGGLGLSALGSKLSGAVQGAAGSVTGQASAVADEVKKKSGKWWPIIIILVLLLLLLYFLKTCNKNNVPATTPSTDTTAAATPADTSANATATLPNGTSLSFPKGSLEDKFLSYLKDSTSQISKTTWFDFDRLLFETGSDKLQPSSMEQLNNVASILKAYPDVHIKIGGYTDSTGNAQANLRLSENRANSVMAQLRGMAIDSTRMEAKGYGSEHPVASNATAEGRAKNRRISLNVTAK